MGDEIRVTVIATGIGTETEKAAPAASKPGNDPTYGGKVRDITPADLTGGNDDLEEPTYRRVRRQQMLSGEQPASLYKGYKGMVIDNNDLDVPTFLRRKAD
jgi:cell division protein FtsZ